MPTIRLTGIWNRKPALTYSVALPAFVLMLKMRDVGSPKLTRPASKVGQNRMAENSLAFHAEQPRRHDGGQGA